MTSGCPENPRMTPNRRSAAYALYALRPIVPQPPDVLAADPPASQEPLPPSGTEDMPVTEYARFPRRPSPPRRRLPLAASPKSRCSRFRRRIKIRKQYKHCAGGCGPQILSAFVKQRTYPPLATGNSTHRNLSSHCGEYRPPGFVNELLTQDG